MSMVLQAFGQTDRGITRERNEDSFGIVRDLSLFVVADGIGGRPAGDVASRMAVEAIEKHVRSTLSGSAPLCDDSDPNRSAMANVLASALRAANLLILREGENDPSRRGMGTTVAAVWCAGSRACIAHVGDSRVYLLRESLTPVTQDHTLAAELVSTGVLTPEGAQQYSRKNIVTRALGVSAQVEVSLTEIELRQGDRLLLCTDGLTDMVPDPVIHAVLSSYPAKIAVRSLINLANQSGGHDNITVILVCCDPADWRSKLKGAFSIAGKEHIHGQDTR